MPIGPAHAMHQIGAAARLRLSLSARAQPWTKVPWIESIRRFMTVIGDDGRTTRRPTVREACEQLLVQCFPFLLQHSLDFVRRASQPLLDAPFEDTPEVLDRVEVGRVGREVEEV